MTSSDTSRIPSTTSSQVLPPPLLSFPNKLSIHPKITRAKAGVLKPKISVATTKYPLPLPAFSYIPKLTSVEQALSNPKWKEAIDNKYASILQTTSIDYNETFSPVVKPTTVRTILSLALSNKWTVR